MQKHSTCFKDLSPLSLHRAEITLIGLAITVSHCLTQACMCAYNRTVAKVDHFLENKAKGHLHVSYSQYRGLQVGCLQKANRQWLSST